MLTELDQFLSFDRRPFQKGWTDMVVSCTQFSPYPPKPGDSLYGLVIKHFKLSPKLSLRCFKILSSFRTIP